MTDVLDDMATALFDAGVIAANLIWLDYRPDTPNRLLALTRYAGTEPLRTMGPGMPAATRPQVQVVARDTQQVAASDLAWAAWKALEAIANTTVNGVYFERVEALQEPFLLDRDELNRWLYAFNVRATRTLT